MKKISAYFINGDTAKNAAFELSEQSADFKDITLDSSNDGANFLNNTLQYMLFGAAIGLCLGILAAFFLQNALFVKILTTAGFICGAAAGAISGGAFDIYAKEHTKDAARISLCVDDKKAFRAARLLRRKGAIRIVSEKTGDVKKVQTAKRRL